MSYFIISIWEPPVFEVVAAESKVTLARINTSRRLARQPAGR